MRKAPKNTIRERLAELKPQNDVKVVTEGVKASFGHASEEASEADQREPDDSGPT